ncbi:MAG: hypothetical protein RL088_210 [Verrucomicrobiota bacterium]|jgi:hypothetical protein
MNIQTTERSQKTRSKKSTETKTPTQAIEGGKHQRKSASAKCTLGDVRAFKAVIKLQSEATAFSEKKLKNIIRDSMLDFSRSETHALINGLRIGAASLVLRKKLKRGQFLKYRNEIFKKWSAPTLNRYLALAKRLPEIGKLPSNTNLTEVYRLLGITKRKESASHTRTDVKKHPSRLPVRADDLRAYAETMEPDKMEEGERREVISELDALEKAIQQLREKLIGMRRGSDRIDELAFHDSPRAGEFITGDKSPEPEAANPSTPSILTTSSQESGTQD